MAQRTRYGFWIDDEQRDALRLVKERDGILESEQIRRAITAWLETKGAIKRTPTRARARKERTHGKTTRTR